MGLSPRDGPCVVSIEDDPVRSAVAQNLCELAGLSQSVLFLVGASCLECLPAAARAVGSVDFALLHHAPGSELLSAMEYGESLGLINEKCTVLVDHMLLPGMPALLWRLSLQPSYEMELVAIQHAGSIQGEDEVEDWMALCHGRSAGAALESVEGLGDEAKQAAFPALAALKAESDSFWRRCLSPVRPAYEIRHRFRQAAQ